MKSVLRFVLWIAGILAVVAGLLYAFVFDVWTVPSDDPAMTASIAPTLAPGDVVLVSRHAGVTSRAFLARCSDPDAPGRFVIGRVAALPGQEIHIASDGVQVDGANETMTGCDAHTVTIENPTTHEPTELTCARTDSGGVAHEVLRGRDRSTDEETKVTVDPGRVFLVSDDVHFHEDSRDYGQIDPATCQHLVYRLVSASGISDRPRRFTLLW